MEPDGSLTCSQKPGMFPYSEAGWTSQNPPATFLRSTLILPSHPHLRLPNGFFHSGFAMKLLTQSSSAPLCLKPHPHRLHYWTLIISGVDCDSSVGITTCYGLDGPGIESLWRRDFTHPSRPALDPPSLLYNGYRVFPGSKAAGAWRWPPTPIYSRG